jgi:hypothetical protein
MEARQNPRLFCLLVEYLFLGKHEQANFTEHYAVR